MRLGLGRESCGLPANMADDNLMAPPCWGQPSVNTSSPALLEAGTIHHMSYSPVPGPLVIIQQLAS